MAISVQAGTGTGAIAPATITPALPADVVAGDLLLLMVDIANVTTATSPGYTQIHSGTGALDQFFILTKTAGSSETAPVVTLGTATDCCAIVVRVRGWDTGGGPAQITTQASMTTTASIDPPTAGSVKIAAFHADPTTAGTVTWTGGATALGEAVISNRAFISAAYKMEDTAGAITFTTTVAGAGEVVILSIAPSAGVAPVAAFSGTPLTGDAPLNVTFTDASTNTPTSWAWTFGDGGTSTSQNPSHNYTVPGVYNVQLTATNAAGSDAELKTGYVTVNVPPDPLDYAEGGGITIA